MNCRPGDLAVIVNCDLVVNVGALVHVIARINDGHLKFWMYEGEEWECEPATSLEGVADAHGACARGSQRCAIFDRDLRPIRDSEGEDEMLTLVGKPEQVTA